MNNVLITGANGFLGQHLCLHLAVKKYRVFATGRGERRLPANNNISYFSTDLTNEAEVTMLLSKVRPDVIIHTAAMSKPDECLNNKLLCLANNVTATRNLVENSNAFFLYTSTDFVFGEDGPHSEKTPPCPLNFYGESKLLAENMVTRSGRNYSIVRPVFIYGQAWQGLRPSFLHWVKNNLEQGKQIKVVSDQQRTPTYVTDICNGIERIIEQRLRGTFHLAGKDVLSPYQMALSVANTLGLNASLIQDVTSDTFPEPVRRAKRSGLTIDKAIRELAYTPVAFEEGVRLTFG